MFNHNEFDYYFIIVIKKFVIPVFKMIAGTEKKKEVMNLAFHGLEGSMTFPSLNCAVGRGWW